MHDGVAMHDVLDDLPVLVARLVADEVRDVGLGLCRHIARDIELQDQRPVGDGPVAFT